MISSVDHLIIAVKDLDQAINDYEKVLGVGPCWKGKHTELGTKNALFNFENTYLELLSPCDAGPGTEFINSLLAEKGDHLAGIVLGTQNIEHAQEDLNRNGYAVEISSGEAINEKDGKIRRWKNIFLPNTLSRELFIFIIQHTEGNLPQRVSHAGAPHGTRKCTLSAADHSLPFVWLCHCCACSSPCVHNAPPPNLLYSLVLRFVFV